MRLAAPEPHPDARAAIDHVEDALVPSYDLLTVEGARRLSSDLYGSQEPIEPVGAVRDLLVPGPDGGDLPIRVYVPEGEGPFPVLPWFHGGGFVLGSVETHDPTCRILTNATGRVVVSVDYRLAPEHPFPAAVRDCYAATEWALENAGAIRGDPDRFAVGGQSAGGNLAAVVCLLARERGLVDRIDHQALIYPVTDYAFDTDSYEENAEGYYLTRRKMEWLLGHYVRADLDRHHPCVSPLRAPDLGGLPSATVLTAGFDPLRDEGLAYADRLEAAGVAVDRHHYDDMIHGFFAMHEDPEIPRGREAIDRVADALEAAER